MFQLEVVRRKRQLTVENNLLDCEGVITNLSEDDALDIKIADGLLMKQYLDLSLKNVKAKQINIICGKGSNVRILIKEYYEDKNFRFLLQNNAELSINFLSIDDIAKGNYAFELNEHSRVVSAMADLSKGVLNFEASFDLVGNGASAEWHLATLGAEDDAKVFNINFSHIGKETYGMMSNYGVVEDRAFMHFKGDSHIVNGATRSKTHQNAKIMVFDEKCRAKANPILKIDENDIEASHAAVVGKVNDEHMFYLCSRGIKENDAKQLITLGYLKPIINYFNAQEEINMILDGIEKRL